MTSKPDGLEVGFYWKVEGGGGVRRGGGGRGGGADAGSLSALGGAKYFFRVEMPTKLQNWTFSPQNVFVESKKVALN